MPTGDCMNEELIARVVSGLGVERRCRLRGLADPAGHLFFGAAARLLFAHRAFCASEMRFRAAADIVRFLAVGLAGVAPLAVRPADARSAAV